MNISIFVTNKLQLIKTCNRNYVSALFLTGNKAKENFAVLTPYMDFNKVFGQSAAADEMKNNLLSRQMSIDFIKLTRKYERYKCMKDKEKHIEKQREEIVSKLKDVTSKDNNSEEISYLKAEGKKLREELKVLKDQLFPVEEDFIDDFLKLPNKIHPKVQQQSVNAIFYQRDLDTNVEKTEPHLKFTDLIKFKNGSYYLFKEAAKFDTEFPFYCSKYFINNGFTQISNPDFSRTVLLEAATIPNDIINNSLIDEKESTCSETISKVNQLHLTGGGTLIGFLGYITKMAIFSSNLPLKLISSGRQYYFKKNKIDDLYTTNQTNAVQIFSATTNENDAEQETENALNLIIEIYNKLNINFRIIFAKSNEMLPAETLRAKIQIFSSYHSNYIDVGYISNYSNFISKRILFCIRDKKIERFPYIVSGTIIDTAKLIAGLLESRKSLLIDYEYRNFK